MGFFCWKQEQLRNYWNKTIKENWALSFWHVGSLEITLPVLLNGRYLLSIDGKKIYSFRCQTILTRSQDFNSGCKSKTENKDSSAANLIIISLQKKRREGLGEEERGEL